MKVNEIINEGWRDYIPKFVPAKELEAEKQRKKQEKYVYQQSARFGDAAYKELEKELAKQNVRLADPRTYNALQGYSLADFVKAFALNFFGSDYRTGNLVKNDINKIPFPPQMNPGSIRQYLNDANEKYRAILNNQLGAKMRQDAEAQQQSQEAVNKLAYGVYTKQMDPVDIPAQLQNQVNAILQNPPAEWQAQAAAQQQARPAQPAQPAQPAAQGPQLAPGVSVVSTSPVILRYGKKDYYIADDGMWHEKNNRNPVDDTWQQFFDQQAEMVEPQMQVVQKPAPAPRAQQPAPQQRVAPAAKPQPTPAQIRQQKQALATQQAQREMKPRIKVRPGETPAQAIARARTPRT